MNQWISVKERLPKEKDEVLIYAFCIPYKSNFMTVANLDFGHWSSGEGWFDKDDYDITHWMSLPEPPE